MDLEDFEHDPELQIYLSSYNQGRQLSPNEALHAIDDQWYIEATRRARWMDLIGDYGGKETFFIEGDSLIQLVLDTPSLALGRSVVLEDSGIKRVDNSFQLLHAKFILEKYLSEFTQRETTFEIVFFNDVRHASIGCDGSRFRKNSRALARKMLFHHMVSLNIPIYSFDSPDDLAWTELVSSKQPMFILANDGGTPADAQGGQFECALFQRKLLFEMSCQGLAFALLKGAEYRDSKIMTFVYESRTHTQNLHLNPDVQQVIDLSRHELDERLGYITPLSTPATPHSLQWWFERFPDSDLMRMFIIHAWVLPRINVQLLARGLPVLHSELESHLQETFLPAVLRTFAQSEALVPDIDGRLFLEFLWFIIQTKSDCIERVFPSLQEADVDLQFLSKLSFNGPSLAIRYPSPPNEVVAASPPQQYQLLTFSNDVFNTALANVYISGTSQSNADVSKSVFGMHILANDTRHWHNRRSILPSYLGGQKNKPTTNWEKRRRDRAEKRDQTRLQRQAASLIGASGNMLEKIIIAPVGSKPRNYGPSLLAGADKTKAMIQENNSKTQKRADNKPKPLTGVNKARAKIQEEKSKKIEMEAVEWWRGKLKAMSSDSVEAQLRNVESLKRNPSHKATYPAVAFEIRLYQLHLILKNWTMQLNPNTHRDDMVVEILRLLSEIKQNRLPPTIPTIAHKFLVDVCLCIGFEGFTNSLLPAVGLSLESCTFKLIKLVSVSKKTSLYSFMSITVSPVEWQLEHFGEYMDRSMDSAPDARVAFSPDRWQREVLDAIDRDESLLALAPTSAGKTFISFYAMEKVLRQSDDGILVYIAPTKALVNQIAAEVYGRFSKNHSGNQTLLAVHTRDTRTGDLQRAQILITVPEMLGILILSPTLAQNWTSRIKRIILDEIHSIGQEQEGAVWEQILLLAPCPIIGLSATVGSPEQFNEWLASVQKAHCFKHVYIHHPHRYSHLRKFFYLPSPKKSSFTSLSNHKFSERLEFLHPLSLLFDKSNNLPVDMTLEPRDCLSLYRALRSQSLFTDDDLSPDAFFKGRVLLCQKDILEYERALKDVVVNLMAHDARSMSKIILSLTPQSLTGPTVDIPPSKDEFKESLMTLVCDLHELDNLPAILFSFDRSDCEVMAKLLTEKLESAETAWKQSSHSWKTKLTEVENWRKLEKVRSAQRQKEMKQKRDHDAPREDASSSSYAWQATFNENDPIADFSFAGRPPSVAELDQIIQDLSGRRVQAADWAIRALRRGIAVHHAGMSKAYRVAIENLFRQGFIRVMISTGTLALGINAPARTSVFCGDSPYLTALMYRQCAGRAGRRGFDLLGNVVFYGLPYSRVQRLVLSRLPALGDSFPLTSTFILRLFNLLEGSNYAGFAVQSVKSVMNLPRISHRSDMGRDQVLHHVRFSIEYLRRAGLLNSEGKPTNLFGMTSHLYHTEPSNFALVHLFECGVIHNICAQSSSVKAETDLLLLLCHLFGRRYISRNYSQPGLIARLRKKYPSQIILPPLSSSIAKQLQHHNDDIVEMFSSYALSYAAENQSSLGIDDALPLSGPALNSVPLASAFIDHLNDTKIVTIARSVFAATSGLDDHFTSIYELVSTVRKGIYLHEHAIPSMQGLIDHSDLPDLTQPEHELNAYIFDFYSHGQVSTLANANGIRRGDVWYELQEFYLTLKTIQTSLQELLIELSLARNKEVKDSVNELLDLEDEEDDEEDPVEEEDEDEDDGIEGFKRPPKTSPGDWKVYEIFDLITNNFGKKFHDIFA